MSQPVSEDSFYRGSGIVTDTCETIGTIVGVAAGAVVLASATGITVTFAAVASQLVLPIAAAAAVFTVAHQWIQSKNTGPDIGEAAIFTSVAGFIGGPAVGYGWLSIPLAQAAICGIGGKAAGHWIGRAADSTINFAVNRFRLRRQPTP